MIARKTRSESGQALMATVSVVAVVALIVIGSIVARNMSTQSTAVSSQHSNVAFQMARIGVEKGIHALNSVPGNWALLGNGGTITGFNGDVVYADAPGGQYKVVIQKDPSDPNSRDIIGYGKDNSTSPQYKGLEIVLNKSSAQFGAIMAPDVKLSRRTKVHWGPIYAYDKLDLPHQADRVYFPRLFSMGKITHIDVNPSLPNTDGVRWWSFNFAPGLPAWPQVDLNYYKALAQAQGNYFAKGDRHNHVSHGDDALGHRDDSDRDDDDSWTYENVIDTQDYVRFYDQGVKAKFKGGNNLLRGVIIAMDSVEFKDNPAPVSAVNAAYAAAALPAYYPHAVNIPSSAWMEYQKIDTAQGGDYPGDIGGPGASGVNATYNFGSAQNDSVNTDATLNFQGFLYAGNSVKFHRGGVFAGTIMAASKSVTFANSDEDDQESDDNSYDCDKHSTDSDNGSNENSDHHGDVDPPDLSEHVDHNACGDWSGRALARRLSVFFLNDLNIQIIGSGQKQTLWKDVPAARF